MKKLTLSILASSLLAGALFAQSNHMGNHMDMSNMSNQEMKTLMKECAALHSQKTKASQSLSDNSTNILEELYAPEEFSG